MSLKAVASVANVLLITDGLFLTLGKIMLPFFETLALDEAEDPSIALEVGVEVMVGKVVVTLATCGT